MMLLILTAWVIVYEKYYIRVNVFIDYSNFYISFDPNQLNTYGTAEKRGYNLAIFLPFSSLWERLHEDR